MAAATDCSRRLACLWSPRGVFGCRLRSGRRLPVAQGRLVRHHTPHGRLMLTVLGGLAEFERELIRARTGEGRKRAKERGVRFGRPRKKHTATLRRARLQ